MPLHEPRLIVEPLEGREFLVTSELGVLDCVLQHADGLVIDLHRNGIRMPVLAAMGE